MKAGIRVVEAEPRPRVLVVDDEPFNLQVLERVFRRDFELVFATSGAEAIEALLRVDFDVALVDYVMPGMNGVELLRRIAELAPTVHRVLLTAYADMQEVKAAQESGLSMALVPKPWDRDQLFKLVTSLASLARVLRSARARLKDSSGP
jgi:serine/threonine-protein kinase